MIGEVLSQIFALKIVFVNIKCVAWEMFHAKKKTHANSLLLSVVDCKYSINGVLLSSLVGCIAQSLGN